MTKNVPDAMDWHFSGTWHHMFAGVPRYRDSWNTAWKVSADLLERSVSVPIFVKSSEDDMRKQGEAMLAILKAL